MLKAAPSTENAAACFSSISFLFFSRLSTRGRQSFTAGLNNLLFKMLRFKYCPFQSILFILYFEKKRKKSLKIINISRHLSCQSPTGSTTFVFCKISWQQWVNICRYTSIDYVQKFSLRTMKRFMSYFAHKTGEVDSR